MTQHGEVDERLFGGRDVVPVQADWTLPDLTITTYLESFDRYGIPFSVVYGLGAPDGIPLPEILTEEAVLGALDRVGGR